MAEYKLIFYIIIYKIHANIRTLFSTNPKAKHDEEFLLLP